MRAEYCREDGRPMCRERGDERCACEAAGFVDWVDEKTGRRTGGPLFRCVTCGRMFREGGVQVGGPKKEVAP